VEAARKGTTGHAGFPSSTRRVDWNIGDRMGLPYGTSSGSADTAAAEASFYPPPNSSRDDFFSSTIVTVAAAARITPDETESPVS
jgi:hypothetical protein